MPKNVVILGNGVTGVSAAIRLRELQPDWKITMVSGESQFHYSRPALMYIFMGHMRYQDTKPYPDHFWDEQRIDLKRAWVTEVDTSSRRLLLHGGGELAYDSLLIATGSKSNKFGWPGQDLDGVQGLWDLLDLRLMYENTKNARRGVIVGGGLIGIELAEMLLSRGIKVTFLVREASYWRNILPAEESEMINQIIRHEGIDLRLNTSLKEIVGDSQGRVEGILTDGDERIDCQFVGLTPGVSPRIDLLEGSGIETGRGILVDRSLRTSTEGVFAAGDCAEIRQPGEERNLLQQVWYTGKAQGRVAAESIAGHDAQYEPGLWYNSAKFFDLEYQTYGMVNAHPKPEEKQLYWESADHQHCLRIVVEDDVVKAMNVMGMRQRHKVWESWILAKRSPQYVLDHLEESHFDPELFHRHEPELKAAMMEQLKAQAVGGSS